jgi:F-type H+-transporting ATPase subunit gamma
MEMVSVAKMKKSTDVNSKNKAYAKFILELMSHIGKDETISNPLMNESTGGKELVVVISSNKGLAGSYNTNISKALTQYKKASGADIDCVTIGKQSEKSARRNKLPIIASFVSFSEKTTSEELLPIRDILVSKFLEGGYKKVSILYTEWKSATNYKPYLQQILPVNTKLYKNFLLEDEPLDREDTLKEYKFEPDMQSVLDQVIPQVLMSAIYHAYLEANASEHSARMFAMKNASDNANDILSNLTLFYNQARQAAITQEISEIVGGASTV